MVQVCVRVVKGMRYSEWSNKFSLEALGSEGIFSCSFKNPTEELQVWFYRDDHCFMACLACSGRLEPK